MKFSLVLLCAVTLSSADSVGHKNPTKQDPATGWDRLYGSPNATGCIDQAAKQAWWAAQVGPGTVQPANHTAGPGLHPDKGWEGDSKTPGKMPQDGCVNAGSESKGAKVMSGSGQIFPFGTQWSEGKVTDLCDLMQLSNTTKCARGIHSIDPASEGQQGQSAPTRLKELPRSAAPPRLALYHGGIIGQSALDYGVFKKHVQAIVDFVAYRGINRIMLVLTSWNEQNIPFMRDAKKVVEAYIEPLYRAWRSDPTNWIDSEAPDVGIVAYFRPSDANYDVSTMNNVSSPITPPLMGGICAACTTNQTKQCGDKGVELTELDQINPTFAAQDRRACPAQAWQPLGYTQPLAEAGRCSVPCNIQTAAGDCVGCSGTATCGCSGNSSVPGGCPDTADQVAFWVQQVNAEVRKSTVFASDEDRERFVITNLVGDGEDMGDYQSDTGITQISQMAWRRGHSSEGKIKSDIKNLGVAKSLQNAPTDVLKNVQKKHQILGQTRPPAGRKGSIPTAVPGCPNAPQPDPKFPGGTGMWTYYAEVYWYLAELFPATGNSYQLTGSWAGDGTEGADDRALSSTITLGDDRLSTIATINSSYRKFAATFGRASDQATCPVPPAGDPVVDINTTALHYLYMRFLESASAGNSELGQYHAGKWQEAQGGLETLATNVRQAGWVNNDPKQNPKNADKCGRAGAVIPLLSIENLAATSKIPGAGGTKGLGTRDCLAMAYYGKAGGVKPDLCGTFDGFAYWSWEAFYQFSWLFSDYMRFAKIELPHGTVPVDPNTNERGWMGIYEAQFIPAEWMPGCKFPNDTDTHWEDYWRFEPECLVGQFPCGGNATDPDRECKQFSADSKVIEKLQGKCPGSTVGSREFDVAKFGTCDYKAGRQSYCYVEDRFVCKSDADCEGTVGVCQADGYCGCYDLCQHNQEFCQGFCSALQTGHYCAMNTAPTGNTATCNFASAGPCCVKCTSDMACPGNTTCSGTVPNHPNQKFCAGKPPGPRGCKQDNDCDAKHGQVCCGGSCAKDAATCCPACSKNPTSCDGYCKKLNGVGDYCKADGSGLCHGGGACCVGATIPPTKAPTKAPVKSPTRAPTTKAPTKAPTTKAPTTKATTTKAPTTKTPTKAPTTKAPVKVPRNAPITKAPNESAVESLVKVASQLWDSWRQADLMQTS